VVASSLETMWQRRRPQEKKNLRPLPVMAMSVAQVSSAGLAIRDLVRRPPAMTIWRRPPAETSSLSPVQHMMLAEKAATFYS